MLTVDDRACRDRWLISLLRLHSEMSVQSRPKRRGSRPRPRARCALAGLHWPSTDLPQPTGSFLHAIFVVKKPSVISLGRKYALAAAMVATRMPLRSAVPILLLRRCSAAICTSHSSQYAAKPLRIDCIQTICCLAVIEYGARRCPPNGKIPTAPPFTQRNAVTPAKGLTAIRTDHWKCQDGLSRCRAPDHRARPRYLRAAALLMLSALAPKFVCVLATVVVGSGFGQLRTRRANTGYQNPRGPRGFGVLDLLTKAEVGHGTRRSRRRLSLYLYEQQEWTEVGFATRSPRLPGQAAVDNYDWIGGNWWCAAEPKRRTTSTWRAP